MADQAASTAAPQRKLLGAFYTESETAGAIAQLAVTSANEAILDPSFGGAPSPRRSVSRLRSLGRARADGGESSGWMWILAR